jgi:hypothetical protein
MAIANECQPYYTPGRDLTGTASGAITGKRCLAIGGNRNSDGTLNVAHATAAGAIVGVSSYDAASGEVVGSCAAASSRSPRAARSPPARGSRSVRPARS